MGIKSPAVFLSGHMEIYFYIFIIINISAHRVCTRWAYVYFYLANKIAKQYYLGHTDL